LKVVSPEGLVQGLGQIAAARLAGHGGCSHGHTSSGKIRMIRTPPSIATNGRRAPNLDQTGVHKRTPSRCDIGTHNRPDLIGHVKCWKKLVD